VNTCIQSWTKRVNARPLSRAQGGLRIADPAEATMDTLPRGRSLRHDIADALRVEILDGRLEPGERVLEIDLARRFGVSRQPVREAIRSLEHEGLLTSLPNRGTFVTRVSFEDALAIQDIRAELEGLAARLGVTHLTQADFVRLDEIVQQMRAAGDRKLPHELVALDLEFHQLINTRSEHRLLLEVLGSVAVYTRGFIVHTRSYYGRQADLAFVANSHAALLEELRAGEPERAQLAVKHHIQSALASLVAAPA
jgi:DNA-binding GntR family transcriptional regulator